MQKKLHLPPTSLPDFEPVPRRPRQDGWTPERQRGFIEALADTGSVKHAAARMGMAPEGAYMLRRAPGAESFAAAWLAALDHGVRQLEDLALERAIHGVEEPIYNYGKLVGARRVYNDGLLMFILRNRLPERYAASAMRSKLLSDEMRDRRLREQELDEEAEIDALNAHFDEVRARLLGYSGGEEGGEVER